MANLIDQINSDALRELTIVAGDDMAELLIIGGDLKVIKRGYQSLKVELPTGVYKLKQRLGKHVSEKLIFLKKDQQFEQFDRFNIESAVPNSGFIQVTKNSSEHDKGAPREIDHEQKWQDFAMKARAPDSKQSGDGAEISVFFRLDPLSKPNESPPERGLPFTYDLLDSGGDSVIDGPLAIDQRDIDGRFYGLTVMVNPGIYYLTMYAPSSANRAKMATQQTIFASLNWQTRLYGFLIFPDAVSPLLQLDSERLSINMTRIGQSPTDKDMRLVETARQAFLAGQSVDYENYQGMLVEKFNDPMLGLFAAHTILNSHSKRLSRIESDGSNSQKLPDVLYEVIGKLKRLFSAHDASSTLHPDVAILMQYASSGGEHLSIEHPPMLLSSWRLLVEMSLEFEDNNGFIQEDSDLERVSMHIINSRPWMQWKAPRAASRVWQLATDMRRTLSGLVWDERLDVLPDRIKEISDKSNHPFLSNLIAEELMISALENKSNTDNWISDETAAYKPDFKALTKSAKNYEQFERRVGQRLSLPRTKTKQILSEYAKAYKVKGS